jgi:ATP-dependent Lon protease
MHSETVIPIFPLGLVMLPEMSLPLHIFEERYKSMTNACIEQQKEFGIVYFSGKQLQTIGCTARIEKILKRYADGRLDIMTRGANRFWVRELHDEKPYLQAEIEFFNDTPEEGTEVETLHKLADRGYQLLRQINTTTEQYNEDRFTNQPDYKTVSFIIAACEGFSFEEKQRFLEMTSTAKRLSSALEALEKLVERIRITRKIASIIGGNGNLPKPL